jgi:hypothetical protein
MSPTYSKAQSSCFLHRAIRDRDHQRVERLLEAGADIEERNEQGDTTLICAISMGAMTLAKKLLASGAQPNARGCNGKTALMVLMEAAPRVNGHNPSQRHRQLNFLDDLMASGSDPLLADSQSRNAQEYSIRCFGDHHADFLLVASSITLTRDHVDGWASTVQNLRYDSDRLRIAQARPILDVVLGKAVAILDEQMLSQSIAPVAVARRPSPLRI